ncbi:MAG TPA: NAD(P)H-binding protein [Solirubrobacteraceae bacterium]|nr:NAD(P)H-binding protein [Solirubrobacteraceae bacterium]
MKAPMRILLTGASGSIGAALAPALAEAGHAVRGFGRDPARVPAELEFVQGDAITGAGLDEALDDIDVAYFLIHSMEGDGRGGFEANERAAAANFVAAAQHAGVRRVIYLGGLVPQGRPPSRHLRSRLEVEQILLAGLPEAVALRASIVIGARSRSFRFMVHLVERMGVLTLPPWREHRTQPIDARDVGAFLLAAATTPHAGGGLSLDIAGPDVLTYGQMIERIADLMLVRRRSLRFGRNATPLVAPIAAAIAGEDTGFIAPLMESLAGDLLPRDGRAAGLLGVRLHRFDAAVERALREWEASEPLAAR